MNLTRLYNTSPDPSLVNEVIARRLARWGDTRDVDEISDAEFNEFYLDAFPEVLLNDKETDSKTLEPRIYNKQSSSWTPHNNQDTSYKKGDILKIVSWKLFPSASSLAAVRASAAIDHLRNLFTRKPHNLVVMLQEIRKESLDAILKHKWTQQNFVLSDTEPPYVDEIDDGEGDLESSQCFSIVMISRNLPISNCFRVPFDSATNSDALVVDVPVSESEDHGPEVSKQSLRLCTARLEPTYDEPTFRYDQLSLVSDLLQGDLSKGQNILSGLVGGNMGPLAVSERDIHREYSIGLKDIWDDRLAPVQPTVKPSGKNAHSKAKSDAWMFHPDRKRRERNLDKFLYRGSIETVALDEAQETTSTRKVGHFGMKLKTKDESKNIWVSEHYGIMVGIKVV
ncbi:unnamed protein product [Fusarium langsethiae]|nr:unnamed protein product [Fusarium langsethiae]